MSDSIDRSFLGATMGRIAACTRNTLADAGVEVSTIDPQASMTTKDNA